MRKYILILILICFSLTFCTITVNAENNIQNNGENWFTNLIFKDSGFSFELIRVLGASYTQGSDVGEVITTAKKIKECDFQSWYEEWNKLADQVASDAAKWEKQGYTESAREAYYKAASYYRIAGFYMDAPEVREKSLQTAKKSKDCFLKAIKYMPYIKPIRIPYEKTTLPGYFITSDKSSRKSPLVIIHTGFDGTGEEICMQFADAARSRGYNCLVFEGPGQGSALREQNLIFRPDWENVVTPVVDWAVKRHDVDKDKIALIGISFGGYLAPRAVSVEHRIKACIANGGIYDVASNFTDKVPESFLKLMDTNPRLFDTLVQNAGEKNPTIKWGLQHGMWVLGASSPSEYVKKTFQYTMKGHADKIKCNMLVIDSSADQFMHNQAKILYDALKCPKEFYMFTGKNASQAHCQMGAASFSNAIMFNWLDKVLKK
ncbi:MAG: alpha/beta fold hydrolase [Firmicutes bacterium]|nr:alpha/beta fold hydrolase [Bacillota bacterium]